MVLGSSVVSYNIQCDAVLDECFGSDYDLIETCRGVQSSVNDGFSAAGKSGFFNSQNGITLGGTLD
jgi:hypothetical protein